MILSYGSINMKLKILSLAVLLVSFNSYGWFDWLDKYDSYGECMHKYEFDKSFVESVCPGCNDWQKDARKERAKDKKAELRCLDYLKPWE